MKRIKVVALALLLLTGIALVIQQQRFGSKQENKVTEFRDQPESKDGEKMNSEPRQENTGPLFISTSQLGIHDSPFFIFNNGDPEDYRKGDQFFGSFDKIGVDSQILAQFPGLENDFIAIRDQKAARVQFLQDNGQAINDATLLWHCIVFKSGIVAGQSRIRVDAMVGNDVEERGGISFGVVDAISEIWSIGNGAPPQLLDRQHKLIPDGVHTQAEVSTYQPPLPEIIGSGY